MNTQRNLFMKILMLSLFSGLFVTQSAMAAANKSKTYQVIPAESKVTWLGKKVTGQHDGTILVKDGSLTFKNGALNEAKVTIDMASITNKDLTDKEYNQKLVNHLKSDDFFSVDKHPEATFVTTKVEKEKGNTYKITGDLTIKGITKPTTFQATVKEKDGKANVEGTMKLDRTLWDVRYGSGKFFEKLGDKMIYDDFELTFNLAAK